MTQENKELLLKDLCARLPYGIQIHIDFNRNGHIVGDATLNTITSITGQIFDFTDFKQDFKNGDCCPIGGFGSNKHLHLEEFKPYLRPMSSMTEEERKEYMNENVLDNCDEMNNVQKHYKELKNCPKNQFDEYYHQYIQLPRVHAEDYLNSIHVDYRGFIEKGLALEAPENMYKNEQHN